MKHFFTILLAGLLTVPASGCAITPASAAAAKAERAASQSENADQLVTQYEQAIQATEQSIAALSEAITPLPVQAQPVSQDQKEQCGTYSSQLNAIDQTINTYSKELEEKYSNRALTEEGYDSLSFQLSQLKARAEKLRDTLCVVYGISSPSNISSSQAK